ncbi:UNVERIFIED_CONTAM: hypothetical protein FKN15_017360 [Acipenser sinensis]
MSDSYQFNSLNINALKEPILKKLSELLDKTNSKNGWRKLGEIAGNDRRFRVSGNDMENCSLKVLELEGSPSRSLLWLLGDQGCTVKYLLEFLEAMGHVEAIQCLKPPATDKVALLIGNMSYRNHPKLKAPMVDVYDLTNLLRQLNFKVVSLLDLTESEMRNAVDEFLLLLDKGVYGLLYYAGHGYENYGNSFMVPVDAPNPYRSANCLCVQSILKLMQEKETGLNVFLLDMCRKRNVYDDIIPNVEALRVTANIVFGYATCQDAEAFELNSTGFTNGVFIKFLKKRLLEDEKITVLLDKVAEDMGTFDPTKGKQALEIRSSLSEKRALTDPIQSSGCSEEIMARNLQWEKAHGLLYYAGHGYENYGNSFMVPVDAPNPYRSANCLCVQSILKLMQEKETGLNVFLLDMCRKRNVYDDIIPNVEALRVTANIVFGYATCQDAEAFELNSTGFTNGVFIKFLKKRLLEDEKITVLLDKVAEDMGTFDPTKGKQALEIRSSLSEKRALTDPIQSSGCSEEIMARNLQWEKAHDMGTFDPTKGKQALEIRSSLSEKRALTDPIQSSGCSEEIMARNLQWEKAHELPESMCLEFDCGVQIKLGFAAEFSNVMVIYTSIVKKPEDMTSCEAYVTNFTPDLDVDPKETNKVTPEETGSYLLSKSLPLKKIPKPGQLSFTVCLQGKFNSMDDLVDWRTEVNIGKPLIAKLDIHRMVRRNSCLQTCHMPHSPSHSPAHSPSHSPGVETHYHQHYPQHYQNSYLGVYHHNHPLMTMGGTMPVDNECCMYSNLSSYSQEGEPYAVSDSRVNIPIETTADINELQTSFIDSLEINNRYL